MPQIVTAGGLPVVMGGRVPVATPSVTYRTPSPLSVTQVHSGHSLVDAYMAYPWPGKLTLAHDAITAGGYDPYVTIAKATIPGSQMQWRWNNSSTTGAGLASIRPSDSPGIEQFELVVICDAVPLYTTLALRQTESLDYFHLWIDHAWANGNGGAGAEVMLYTVWNEWQNPSPTSPADETGFTFRERLDIDDARWTEMRDYGNSIRPPGMPNIYMIPGHLLWARVWDDIEAATGPFTAIGQLFSDDIHPNAIGEMAITYLVWACIHHRNPSELPDNLGSSGLTTAQASYLKTIAWEVATGDPRTGVRA